MKSWSKGLVLFLCSVLLFSLVGCGSSKSLKVIDSGDFEDVLEDLDYDVTVYEDEAYLEKGQEEAAYVYEEDFVALFAQYGDEEDAVDDFNDMYDNLTEAKDDEDFDGSYTKTNGKNYQKLVINGEFDNSSEDFMEGDGYIVAFQIENTIIMIASLGNGKGDIKDVKEIVKELGY